AAATGAMRVLQAADSDTGDLRPAGRHREEGRRGHAPGERGGQHTVQRVRREQV
ncbi:MAG: hypothetical protein AVDCRST_MAG02-3843, partial [uncultured Rubrobacteraceae bacterium]